MRAMLCAALVGSVCAAADPTPARAAVFYHLSSGVDYDTAGGVSPDGSVVLTTENVWTPAAGFVKFSPNQFVYSRDISNNGIVVGLTDGSYIAARIPIGGPVQELGAFPGGYGGSDAYAITPDGNVVVGYASSGDGHEAFRWTSATGLVGLGHLAPGNHFSDSAQGVSADGSVVVGVAESALGHEAFRWTQATGMVGLGDLPGGDFNSAAGAISSNGQVVVGGATSVQGVEAFRWTEATGMVGLGDLPGGAFYSEAFAATADGAVVVGQSRTTLIDGDAFIWTAADGMRSLQTVLTNEYGLGPSLVGWRLSSASDISDDGRVIVGNGRAPSGRLEGFVVVIPEPETIWLLMSAAALIMVTARVRRARKELLAVLCLGVSLAAGDVFAAAFYPLGGFASSVSPDGAVVLVGRNVWTPAGGFADILPGVSELYGGNLANGGILAGMLCGPNTSSCYEAYRAPVGGPVQGLGALDDNASHGTAITPDGGVVAGFTSSATGTQSFRWTSATGMVGLGNLVPNANSHDIAYGLSADGSVVVGRSGDDLVHEEYRWTAGGGMVGLGDLPGGAFQSTATVVSADGSVIAGIGTTATGTEAFRWTQATGMVALGDLNPTTTHTETTAMSADGSAIYGLDEDGWIWTQATGMRKVQDVLVNDYGLGAALAGWRIQRIDDVSDDGLVLVGNGLNPAGQSEGFAIVIPEPSAIVMLVAGAALIAASRRRARPSR